MNKALSIQTSMAAVGIIAGILLSLATYNALSPDAARPLPEKPDFTGFTDVNAKKQAFFDYVLPGVRNANDNVLKQRQQVLAWQEAFAKGELSSRQQRRLEAMAEHYEIDPDLGTTEKLELLLRRVDIVPASLALAQAAKESGWGTSRFSRQGNNLFGQWCYREGCGLVPNQRSEGATHEVQVFEHSRGRRWRLHP
ncbi:MAG: glucosaminidase domain-containing protein [Porticoccaceae bacterium]